MFMGDSEAASSFIPSWMSRVESALSKFSSEATSVEMAAFLCEVSPAEAKAVLLGTSTVS